MELRPQYRLIIECFLAERQASQSGNFPGLVFHKLVKHVIFNNNLLCVIQLSTLWHVQVIWSNKEQLHNVALILSFISISMPQLPTIVISKYVKVATEMLASRLRIPSW